MGMTDDSGHSEQLNSKTFGNLRKYYTSLYLVKSHVTNRDCMEKKKLCEFTNVLCRTKVVQVGYRYRLP